MSDNRDEITNSNISEKYHKAVNFPHKGLGKLREKIADTEPDGKIGKTARVAGIGVTGLLEFLVWLFKYILLDNQLTRYLEKHFAEMGIDIDENGQEERVAKFMKEHPTLTTLIIWWFMMLQVLGLSIVVHESNNDLEPSRVSVISIDDDDDNESLDMAEKAPTRPLVGKMKKRKNQQKWTMGKTSGFSDPEQLSPEKLKKVQKMEKKIEKYIKKYDEKTKGIGFDLSKPLEDLIKKEVVPIIWPGFVVQTSFTETNFYDGGPDFSGYVTYGIGSTWATRTKAFPIYTNNGHEITKSENTNSRFERTIRLFWDHSEFNRKVARNAPVIYENYEAKTFDLIRSLGYEQKMIQAQLLLMKTGEILSTELSSVSEMNKAHKQPNEISFQLTLALLSPFWQRPANGRAINFRLSDLEPTNEAMASTYKNTENLRGALSRLFWAYCESKGYLSPEIYLALRLDGISVLLEDYVKQWLADNNLKWDAKNKISNYVKAGVFIPYEEEYVLDKDAMTKRDKKAEKIHIERYHYTTKKDKIKEIIKFAQQRSQQLQNREIEPRNTILRQTAVDLVNNGISPEQFFTVDPNNYDDRFTPYQAILFERAVIYYNSIEKIERIQNLINGAIYEQQYVEDEQIKMNLQQIVLEEKIHITKIEIKKSKNPKVLQERLKQEEKDLETFFRTQEQKLDAQVIENKTPKQIMQTQDLNNAKDEGVLKKLSFKNATKNVKKLLNDNNMNKGFAAINKTKEI